MSQNLPSSPSSSRRARRSLRLVMFESALTHGSLSVAIMTPFWQSIGMNQAEIAASQAIFTLVVMLLNIPTGWLADRFSRKWANVLGDFGCAVTYLFYAQARGFASSVACEIALGLFMAFSQGVDFSLLKHFSEQLDDSFERQSANLAVWQYLTSILLCLLGGPLGAISFRLAIAANGLTYLIAGLASLFIRDDSVRLTAQKTNPVVDMLRITRSSFTNLRLRHRLIAYAIVREMTHGIIWVFTPMLLLAGVPLVVVSSAWALSSLASTLGARLARRFSVGMSAEQKLLVPLLVIAGGLGILTFQINIFTVWCYLLASVAQGWVGASALPLVQQEASPSEQTSVVSLAKVLGQLIYVPAVWLIGFAADFKLQYAAAMTLLLFVPSGLVITYLISKEP